MYKKEKKKVSLQKIKIPKFKSLNNGINHCLGPFLVGVVGVGVNRQWVVPLPVPELELKVVVVGVVIVRVSEEMEVVELNGGWWIVWPNMPSHL